MKRRVGKTTPFSSLVTAGFFVCLLLGCNLSHKLLSKQNMFEGTSTKDAADAFRAKLGGGPVKALSLEIEPDAATLKAQDPKNPQHVDEYKYVKGIVVGPRPVQLNLLENNLDHTLFNLDDINLSATETLARTVLERAKIEGGKIKKMTIERGLSLEQGMTKSGNIRWTIEIEGARENASAVADTKGNVLGLDLSQTARAAQYSTYSADTLREAAPAIKQALGDHVKLIEITIYEKYLWFKAKSPRDGELTQYKYDINGVTSSQLSNLTDLTPTSVRMGEHKIEDLFFELDDVNLAIAPDLGKKALGRLDMSDGKVTHYTIERDPPKFASKDLVTRWDVSCQQGRKTGSVKYDTSGNELDVYRAP